MKGLKISIIIFSILCAATALVSIFSFVIYYGSEAIFTSESGGSALIHFFVMIAGYSIGMYSAIISGINALIVLILVLIRRKKRKKIDSQQ